jgi:hypothetical protein
MHGWAFLTFLSNIYCIILSMGQITSAFEWFFKKNAKQHRCYRSFLVFFPHVWWTWRYVYTVACLIDCEEDADLAEELPQSHQTCSEEVGCTWAFSSYAYEHERVVSIEARMYLAVTLSALCAKYLTIPFTAYVTISTCLVIISTIFIPQKAIQQYINGHACSQSLNRVR